MFTVITLGIAIVYRKEIIELINGIKGHTENQTEIELLKENKRLKKELEINKYLNNNKINKEDRQKESEDNLNFVRFVDKYDK